MSRVGTPGNATISSHDKFIGANPRKQFYSISHIVLIGVVEDLPNVKMMAITLKRLTTSTYIRTSIGKKPLKKYEVVFLA